MKFPFFKAEYLLRVARNDMYLKKTALKILNMWFSFWFQDNHLSGNRSHQAYRQQRIHHSLEDGCNSLAYLFIINNTFWINTKQTYSL